MRQQRLWMAMWLSGTLFLAYPVFSTAATQTQKKMISHGVASGDVTDTAAVIWAEANQDITLTVEYATTSDFSNAQSGGTVRVSAATNFTGTVTVTGLQPATRYYYRVRPQETEVTASEIGSFATAPAPDHPHDVTFIWSGDLGGQGLCRQPEYTIFTPMKMVSADFFIFAGDTIYADSPCPSPPNAPGADFKATTQEQFWAKHRYQREDRPLREMLAATPVYAIWDDHEVKNDFAGPSEPLTPLGLKAFLDYFPVRRVAEEPQRLYRSFSWGRRVEVFILDTRQYRSPNRQADGPDKTMLGSAQLRWLLDHLATSTTTWQIIVSSVPLSAYTGNMLTGNDSWGKGEFSSGFDTELRKIVTTLRDRHLRNVAWISTDIHVARILSYDPDQDSTADFYEFISGPLSAITGNFDPLDQIFHPSVLYEETHFFNFGVVKIDGRSGTLRVEIRDQEGKVHYTLTLPAR
ncbi:MAG TPA: alkaline phosphatase D family protein [Candidatus Binatia bacterium]|jgi:alkaline phosphatase D|nr:alkaline phosphatase D family protein [Candidatus Binatia bacterium]